MGLNLNNYNNLKNNKQIRFTMIKRIKIHHFYWIKVYSHSTYN
jgi:hypothetical protein